MIVELHLDRTNKYCLVWQVLLLWSKAFYRVIALTHLHFYWLVEGVRSWSYNTEKVKPSLCLICQIHLDLNSCKEHVCWLCQEEIVHLCLIMFMVAFISRIEFDNTAWLYIGLLEFHDFKITHVFLSNTWSLINHSL